MLGIAVHTHSSMQTTMRPRLSEAQPIASCSTPCCRPTFRRSTRITKAAAATSSSYAGAEVAKYKLRSLIKDTGRGLRAGKFVRGLVEEAQVELESYAEPELNYNILEGKWRLDYTTASDVLPILEAEFQTGNPFGPSLLQIGNIYQRFSSPAEGIVENIIGVGVPFLLQDREGATLTVGARYEVRGPHRIGLAFEEARVDSIKIGPWLEALLAPAALPRGSLQHQLLLAIKQFQLKIPFQSAAQLARGRGAFADYQLTYLDQDTLIGRASTLGGSFIFTRETSSSTDQLDNPFDSARWRMA